ncbi:MAG: hypothetical protein M1827_004955 [Pycnora praestabilis]|nr:MAG: hypothetical protein M1827_004955 [Pycnora praestabilis]
MHTWLIIGASRGIGLEFVKQLLARGDSVLATARDPTKASPLSGLKTAAGAGGSLALLRILPCDVLSEQSITAFANEVKELHLEKIDYVIINAGVLKYPNRATEISSNDFAYHLHTNTIGPIIAAQKLLLTGMSLGTIMFMSSDSGSTTNFRDFEDGFGAYSASKAALNQMLRHMAAELKRKHSKTVILAMHPGEVATDMANDISVEWEVEGVMTPEESVSAMLKVIPTKTIEHTGTFWTWEGKVITSRLVQNTC